MSTTTTSTEIKISQSSFNSSKLSKMAVKVHDTPHEQSFDLKHDVLNPASSKRGLNSSLMKPLTSMKRLLHHDSSKSQRRKKGTSRAKTQGKLDTPPDILCDVIDGDGFALNSPTETTSSSTTTVGTEGTENSNDNIVERFTDSFIERMAEALDRRRSYGRLEKVDEIPNATSDDLDDVRSVDSYGNEGFEDETSLSISDFESMIMGQSLENVNLVNSEGGVSYGTSKSARSESAKAPAEKELPIVEEEASNCDESKLSQEVLHESDKSNVSHKTSVFARGRHALSSTLTRFRSRSRSTNNIPHFRSKSRSNREINVEKNAAKHEDSTSFANSTDSPPSSSPGKRSRSLLGRRSKSLRRGPDQGESDRGKPQRRSVSFDPRLQKVMQDQKRPKSVEPARNYRSLRTVNTSEGKSDKILKVKVRGATFTDPIEYEQQQRRAKSVEPVPPVNRSGPVRDKSSESDPGPSLQNFGLSRPTRRVTIEGQRPSIEGQRPSIEGQRPSSTGSISPGSPVKESASSRKNRRLTIEGRSPEATALMPLEKQEPQRAMSLDPVAVGRHKSSTKVSSGVDTNGKSAVTTDQSLKSQQSCPKALGSVGSGNKSKSERKIKEKGEQVGGFREKTRDEALHDFLEFLDRLKIQSQEVSRDGGEMAPLKRDPRSVEKRENRKKHRKRRQDQSLKNSITSQSEESSQLTRSNSGTSSSLIECSSSQKSNGDSWRSNSLKECSNNQLCDNNARKSRSLPRKPVNSTSGCSNPLTVVECSANQVANGSPRKSRTRSVPRKRVNSIECSGLTHPAKSKSFEEYDSKLHNKESVARKSSYVWSSAITASHTCFSDDEGDVNVQSSNEDNSLPPEWIVLIDPKSGNPYYANMETDETTWERPTSSLGVKTSVLGQIAEKCQDNFAQVKRGSIFQGSNYDTSLPPEWIVLTDPESGNPYYANVDTNETRWERPVFSDDVQTNNKDSCNESEISLGSICRSGMKIGSLGEKLAQSLENIAQDDSDGQLQEGNDDKSLPFGWTVLTDPESGNQYYANIETNEARWDRPESSPEVNTHEEACDKDISSYTIFSERCVFCLKNLDKGRYVTFLNFRFCVDKSGNNSCLKCDRCHCPMNRFLHDEGNEVLVGAQVILNGKGSVVQCGRCTN